jgi:Ca-activated chloride channel family protein
MICTEQQLGSDILGGGFGGRFGAGDPGGGGRDFRRFLIIDESTLEAVAGMTGGTYYRAENADQLHEIFLNLPLQIVLQKENTEISVFFSTLGAIFALVAVALSILWNRYPQ